MQSLTNTAQKETTQEKVKKQVPKKLKKYLTSTLCLSLVTLGGVQGYNQFFVEEPLVALTGTVTYGQLGTILEGSGNANSAEVQSVSAVSNSEILAVYVSAGDTVVEGQLLYTQDDSEIDEQIELYREEITTYEETISDYYSTISDYEKAISDLREDISEATVTASFSGKISGITVKEGDIISSSTQLGQLTDSSNMDVVLYFSYANENDIHIGDTAEVSIPEQMMILSGTVSHIKKVEYVSKEGTRCFSVTISVKNPNSLQEGTAVSATIGTMYPVEAGYLTFAQDTSVNSSMSGEVTAVYVDNYEMVTAGQTLFQLNTSDLLEQIQEYQDKITSVRSQITTVQSKITSLQEDIAEEEARRSEFQVYSEISGKIISVNVKEGQNASTSMPALVIYNLDNMTFTANIDELDFEHVYQGMPVEVSYSTSNTTQEFQGEISAISYEANNDSGVAYFPITITVESDGAVSSGVTLSYKIAVGDADEGYLVPIDAVQSYENSSYLYIQGTGTSETVIEDLPEGFYPLQVTVLSSNSQYALISSDSGTIQEDMTVFTRYQATAPSGGDTTSATTGDMDMDAMMAMRESMMTSGGMSGTSGSSTGSTKGERGG